MLIVDLVVLAAGIAGMVGVIPAFLPKYERHNILVRYSHKG